MKTFITLLFSVVVAGVWAQTSPEVPRNDYNLSVSETNLALKPGESRNVTVTLLRSKSYAKGTIKMSTSSTLPKGVTVQFSPAEGNFESTVATIAVASEVPSSTFYVIVSSEIYGKVKGKTLKVTVEGSSVVSVRD